MKKPSFISKFFGIIDVLVGIASIIYVGSLLIKVDSFLALSFDDRRFYSAQFLKYCGGGTVHIFTGCSILTRQSVVPVLTFLVAVSVILARIPQIMVKPSWTSQPTLICMFAGLYLLWFMLRQKEFAE